MNTKHSKLTDSDCGWLNGEHGAMHRNAIISRNVHATTGHVRYTA